MAATTRAAVPEVGAKVVEQWPHTKQLKLLSVVCDSNMKIFFKIWSLEYNDKHIDKVTKGNNLTICKLDVAPVHCTFH